jgi:hypothetical protein
MLSPNIGLMKGRDASLVAADTSANLSLVAAINATQAKIKMQECLGRINQVMNYRIRWRNFLGELSMQIIILSIPRQMSMQFSEHFGSAGRESE